jgi:hypothetical protein
MPGCRQVMAQSRPVRVRGLAARLQKVAPGLQPAVSPPALAGKDLSGRQETCPRLLQLTLRENIEISMKTENVGVGRGDNAMRERRSHKKPHSQ